MDASASLIPAVNKLGTMGLILRGSDELKKKVLPSLASGEAMASYALSEREAGSDAASMRTRAKADGDDWILNGAKCWITNGGKSAWYTVMAVTDPDKGANGISAFMVHVDDEGFTIGPKERKLGIKGSPTTELYFENCRIPGDRIIGEPGTGFKTALATLDHTRPTIGAQAVGIAQGALDAAIEYTKDRKQFGKPLAQTQLYQLKLANMLTEINLGLQASLRVGRLLDEANAAPEMISIVKRNNCGKALDIARTARDTYRTFLLKEVPSAVRNGERRRSTVPTRVLFGRTDTAIHPDLAAAETARSEDYQIEVVEGGHFIVDESPHLVRAKLIALAEEFPAK